LAQPGHQVAQPIGKFRSIEQSLRRPGTVCRMTIETSMRSAAVALLAGLDDRLRAGAQHPFDDEAGRGRSEDRPPPRPGVSLADLDPAARKAAHRLLATGLSPHAYAQAMTILALEEVLDRAEGWERGRHSNDYAVLVFGDPQRDERWGWRFEG